MAALDTRGKEVCQVADALFSAKGPWDQYCQSVAEIFYPARADFTQSLNLGDEFGMDILDDSPVLARENLGNIIDSMLRQGPWFTVGTGDEERDEKPANARALDYGTKELRRLIRDPRMQWDTATKQADMDWVTFGTCPMSVEVDRNWDHLLLKSWHPRDCAWMFNESGELDYFCRKMDMPARDIVRRTSKGSWTGKPHGDITKAASTEPFKTFPILHVLMTADEYYESGVGDRKNRTNKPFISLYVDRAHQEILHEGGVRSMRYSAPRYRVLTGHAQGFSPVVWNSLGNSRMLQDMARVILEQGEKAIDPPMIGRGDIFRQMNVYAGGFTPVDLPDGAKLNDVFSTINTADNFSISLELKQDTRELIQEGWLLNKLFLPRLGDMREIEVATRNEEFRRTALPFFSPIETQYHSQILSNIFELAVEVGAINPAVFTPDLQDHDVRFTFFSPIKEIEGQKKVQAFFSLTQIAAAANEVDKTVASIFNWKKSAEDAVRGAGAEADWILDEKERETKDAEDDQMEQLRKAAAVATTGSQVVTDMSQATVAAKQAGLA